MTNLNGGENVLGTLVSICVTSHPEYKALSFLVSKLLVDAADRSAWARVRSLLVLQVKHFWVVFLHKFLLKGQQALVVVVTKSERG